MLAMNWKGRPPPRDFVGFAIQYQEPGSTKLLSVRNRLTFEPGDAGADARSSLVSPIQKFRWIHFPFHAERPGTFTYVVTPVFMSTAGELRYGPEQRAGVVLAAETVPGAVNVAFTRGFVSSQGFVDTFSEDGDLSTLLPARAAESLDYAPTNPAAEAAYAWMGFEARRTILGLLDEAIADESSRVRVIAYDLNLPEVLERLERLGRRLRIIIDNSAEHGDRRSPETRAASRLRASAGPSHVKRQHMAGLQHNKMIVVESDTVNKALCGSTNFSWRAFYVQNNNAVTVEGKKAIRPFVSAFDTFWKHSKASDFGGSPSASFDTVDLPDVRTQVTFSPHSSGNAMLQRIADDIVENTTSSVFYSLAFLAQTRGALRDAVAAITQREEIFVYGIADAPVGGITVQSPSGNVAPVSPTALAEHVPEPFKSEPSGRAGICMHHKFVVIDFDTPSARVYLGSYNFSVPADRNNGENLLLIRDPRVATAFMVEAVRIFDHYEFRLKQQDAATARERLLLRKPPSSTAELPWWSTHWTDPHRVRDRTLFA